MTCDVITLPKRISAGVMPLGELLERYLPRLSLLEIQVKPEALPATSSAEPLLATTIHYLGKAPEMIVTARYPSYFGMETPPKAVVPAWDYAFFFAQRQAEFAAQQAHLLGNNGFISRLVVPNRRVITFFAKDSPHDLLLAYFA